MIFAFIASQADRYPVRLLCRCFEVSPAGYYAFLRRGPSAMALANLELGQRITELYYRHEQRYGVPRLCVELRELGASCSEKRVARLMRQLSLQGLRIRRRTRIRMVMTDPRNLLARDFQPGGKLAICADITEIQTAQGRFYLAAVLCLYTRRLLGWSWGDSPSTQLVCTALSRAVQRQKVDGWLHHSDQGSVYCSAEYLALLDHHGLRTSYSRAGNCYDNGVMESFFSTMKREMKLAAGQPDACELALALERYIDHYYNHPRRHSSLGLKSPETYARMLLVA